MTRAGVGFIAGGVVVYLVSSQAQIGWLYLIDSMIWGVVALSALFPWWSLRSLRVERQVLISRAPHGRQEPASPTEDGTVQVRLKVMNRSRWARYFVRLVEECPLEGPEKRPRVFFLPSIKPRSAVDLSYTATCYRRGHYVSARAVLETAAPIGLFVRRHRYDLPLDVTVYPAHYEMTGMPAADEAWAEQGQTIRSDAAPEFYGSREYHHGDSLKRVHWRNTARLGQFVVKQFEELRHGSVAVAFETKQDWGDGKDTVVEYSVKIAASMARHCGDSGRSVSILAGDALVYGADWLTAMDYLARLTIGASASLEELAVPAGPGQALVAVVSARDTSLIPCLQHLAGRHGSLVVVLLEGFAPGEKPQEFVAGLGANSVHLIRCPLGGLKEAIGALAHSRAVGSGLPAMAG